MKFYMYNETAPQMFGQQLSSLVTFYEQDLSFKHNTSITVLWGHLLNSFMYKYLKSIVFLRHSIWRLNGKLRENILQWLSKQKTTAGKTCSFVCTNTRIHGTQHVIDWHLTWKQISGKRTTGF